MWEVAVPRQIDGLHAPPVVAGRVVGLNQQEDVDGRTIRKSLWQFSPSHEEEVDQGQRRIRTQSEPATCNQPAG
jgi:hypothetical protein